MSQVGLVWDPCFLNHDAGMGHPERPERLVSIREKMQEIGLFSRMEALPTRPATIEELVRNHTPEHVQRVLEADGAARTIFDGDTQASPGTTAAALRAAAGAVDLSRAVWRGELARGFSMGRPPGHHAEHASAMGFCYFNNVAVAARSLIEDEGLERVMIVDWDVHHGNGTQHSFEGDSNVLFFSMHQFPFYPGTGSLGEMGTGSGEGYTVNVPLPAGLGDDEYLFFFERVLRPLTAQYQPQMILLSAGYDAHHRDPLGSMSVSTAGFGALSHSILRMADEFCDGKLVATLEGGYDLEGVGASSVITMQAMLGEQIETSGDVEKASSVAHRVFEKVQQQFDGHWVF